MSLNEIRPTLKLINGTAHLAKIGVLIQPGETLDVPEGSVIEMDRGPLTIVAEVPAKKVPTRKAAVKG